MRRRRKELQVFNMSMLDVLASALGAFLLLFLLSMKKSDNLEEANRQKDEEIERLVQKIQEAEETLEHTQETLQNAQDALADAEDALNAAAGQLANAQADANAARQEANKAREQADALKKEKDKLDALAKGMAIGMCEVDVSTVTVTVWDHGDEDGDRVHLAMNDTTISADLLLAHQKRAFKVPVSGGTNYLIATALNQNAGRNTAMLVVNPCRDGQPRSFQWEMDTNESRHISLVRR